MPRNRRAGAAGYIPRPGFDIEVIAATVKAQRAAAPANGATVEGSSNACSNDANASASDDDSGGSSSADGGGGAGGDVGKASDSRQQSFAFGSGKQVIGGSKPAAESPASPQQPPIGVPPATTASGQQAAAQKEPALPGGLVPEANLGTSPDPVERGQSGDQPSMALGQTTPAKATNVPAPRRQQRAASTTKATEDELLKPSGLDRREHPDVGDFGVGG